LAQPTAIPTQRSGSCTRSTSTRRIGVPVRVLL
jgi:hypothetical protein